MPAFLAALRGLLAACGVVFGAQTLQKVFGWVGVNLVNAITQRAVAIMVIFAWGIFLAAFTTGFDNLHLMDVLHGNPLSGMGGQAYKLFCMVFPFQFFMRLAVAYIVWSFTFVGAASVMTRVVRFTFGG